MWIKARARLPMLLLLLLSLLFDHTAAATAVMPLIYEVGAKKTVSDAEMLTFAMGTTKAPTVCDANSGPSSGFMSMARCVSQVDDSVQAIRVLFAASVRSDITDATVRVVSAPWVNTSGTGASPAPESTALMIVSLVLVAVCLLFIGSWVYYYYCVYGRTSAVYKPPLYQ